MKKLEIDREVNEFIKARKRDYRVCTSCDGAVILPVEIKPPKDSDFEIRIGENTLFVSEVQFKILSRIDASMLYWVKMYDDFPLK